MTAKNFLLIKEAAEVLGVASNTLRNWERRGKIQTRRHPMNGYRMFDAKEIQALLQKLNGTF